MNVSNLKTAITRRQMVDILLNPNLKATLVLKNGLVINVLTREIYQADIAVYNEHILKIGDVSEFVGSNTEVVDFHGQKYISPGFIDSHMHFESSMLTISEFSRFSIPTGTTTLVADPHEIGNALGPIGIKAMADETNVVPNRVYLVVPALTPDCPSLETAGYDISSKDIPELLNYSNVIGIGELQGFSNVKFVYKYTPEIVNDLIASTTYACSLNKVVDGNIPELYGNELAAHIITGGTDVSCHETTMKKECLEKLRYGVYVFMREGSTQKNMSECIRVITEEGLDSRRLIGATDDMVGEDLVKYGHMNWVVARIIKEGIDPVEAIQMVTINPATYFGLKHIGILAPGKMADLVVISDITKMEIDRVYIGGKLIAKDGKMVINIKKYIYPENVKNTIKCQPISAKNLEINAVGNSAIVRTIGVIPDQNLTKSHELLVQVENGIVQPDLIQDAIPIAAIERYGRNGNIGKAFVKGFGLKHGAIAESVCHDAHNIIVVGTNYQDMAVAVNRVIEIKGGVALCKNNKIIGDLRLPVGGLITDELNGFELSNKLEELHKLASSILGCTIHAPFMHLSFLGLTTSAEWKITDRGLIDVNSFSVILPIV